MLAGGWGRKEEQPDDEVVLFSPTVACFTAMPTKLTSRRHGCAGAYLEGKCFVLGGCSRDQFADSSDLLIWCVLPCQFFFFQEYIPIGNMYI